MINIKMKLKKILFSSLSIGLLIISGCNQPKTSTSSILQSSTQADVESVVFSMSNNVLEPGNYDLVASCLPTNSDQGVKFSIVGSVSGVSINDKKLLVSVSAEDKASFIIRAISIYDPSKFTSQQFSINNPTLAVEVRTEEDLITINTTEGLNKKYILKNDIVLTKPWIPIGIADVELDDGSIVKGQYFEGIFDGNGYKISAIQVDGSFNEGFFAQIGANGIVRNTSFEGFVNARGWSGGIAGINGGLIENCISNINVTVLGGSAGALVSVNRGTIKYSYALGKVVASISNDLPRSTGLLSANEGTVTECYGNKDTMESNNFIAFTPVKDATKMLSTSDMKKASTFVAFDSSIWEIVEGSYPTLKHH